MEELSGSEPYLENLPHDFFMFLSRYLSADELEYGLARTNRAFRDLFDSEDYWQERLRGRARDYYRYWKSMTSKKKKYE